MVAVADQILVWMPVMQTLSPNELTVTVPDVQEGLDLNRRRNTLQATAAIVCALIGGSLGPSLVTEGRFLAAICGAFIGLVIGTFIAGFVLMLWPPEEIPIHAALIKYGRIRRKRIGATITWLTLILACPFVLSVFGHDDRPIAWLICFTWIIVTVGACSYARGLAVESHRLQTAISKAGRDGDHHASRCAG